jgi:hypothetical protein
MSTELKQVLTQPEPIELAAARVALDQAGEALAEAQQLERELATWQAAHEGDPRRDFEARRLTGRLTDLTAARDEAAKLLQYQLAQQAKAQQAERLEQIREMEPGLRASIGLYEDALIETVELALLVQEQISQYTLLANQCDQYTNSHDSAGDYHPRLRIPDFQKILADPQPLAKIKYQLSAPSYEGGL